MNGAQARILVVEDEAHLAQGIADNLLLEGYHVEVTGDGEGALQRHAQGGLDLLILDVMLPKRDGYAVCRAIRAQGSCVPILFLTAKNAGDDRICGLHAGGDDYLGKPFDLRELLLRVRAILRRARGGDHRQPPLRLGSLQIDLQRHEVTDADGRVSFMADRETRLMALFWGHVGAILPRDQIVMDVWKHDVYPSTRELEALVQRLRGRFEPDPQNPRYFHTIAGSGYRFTPDETPYA